MTGHAPPLWTVRGGRFFTPAPFGIMGVVNVTPDSFSDGGHHASASSALEYALGLLEAGAHIVDIGGESTRPGATPVPADEECVRILPVVAGLRARVPEALISVDTYHAATAQAALTAGAHIINDVSGCAWEPALLQVLVQQQPGYVLTHSKGRPQTMQNNPQYANVLDAVCAYFEAGMERLARAGLSESHIVLDPGIGFGKRAEHIWTVLRGMERILALGRPVCVGVSRKSFLGHVLHQHQPNQPNQASAYDAATHAVLALLACSGVHLHRVHDVAGAAQALAVAHAWGRACAV